MLGKNLRERVHGIGAGMTTHVCTYSPYEDTVASMAIESLRIADIYFLRSQLWTDLQLEIIGDQVAR